MPFEQRPSYRKPLSQEPKRNQVHIQVTPDEWTIVDETSKELRLSKSDFVRMCISKYLQRQAE